MRESLGHKVRGLSFLLFILYLFPPLFLTKHGELACLEASPGFRNTGFNFCTRSNSLKARRRSQLAESWTARFRLRRSSWNTMQAVRANLPPFVLWAQQMACVQTGDLTPCGHCYRELV